MKVSVYDTYVQKGENTIMHFDILVEESAAKEKVYLFGKDYLNSKGIRDYELSTKECNYCHIELAPEPVEKQIRSKAYYIIEMENCD